eukprot:g3178.t1
MVYLHQVAGHPKRLAPGALTLAVADGLIVGSGMLSGFAIALLGLGNVNFRAPVYAGDTVVVDIEVTKARAIRSKSDRGVVTTHQTVRNQHGTIVLEYDASRMLRKRSGN